jgi:hypothetical protein
MSPLVKTSPLLRSFPSLFLPRAIWPYPAPRDAIELTTKTGMVGFGEGALRPFVKFPRKANEADEFSGEINACLSLFRK